MASPSTSPDYNRIANGYIESANENGKICDDNTNHLSSVLFTATAAILAIVTVALTDTEASDGLTCWQRIICFSATAAFVLSLVMGIFSYIVAITKAKDIQANCKILAENISKNQSISEEDKKLDTIIRQDCDRNSGSTLLFTQVIFFLVGIIMTMIYIYSMLFH